MKATFHLKTVAKSLNLLPFCGHMLDRDPGESQLTKQSGILICLTGGFTFREGSLYSLYQANLPKSETLQS